MQHLQQHRDEPGLQALSSAIARAPDNEVLPAVEAFIQKQLEAGLLRGVRSEDREYALGRANACQALLVGFRQARKVANSPDALRAKHQKKSNTD